jgi:hypothetical protein
MLASLLDLGPLLSLTVDDAALREAVEALGVKAKVKPSDQIGFITAKKAGVEFRFTKESWLADDPGPLRGPYILTTAGVYAAGREGYKAFAGKLPKGVTFGMARDAARAAMGEVVASGGGGSTRLLTFPEWDMFKVARKYLVTLTFVGGLVVEASITLPKYAEES